MVTPAKEGERNNGEVKGMEGKEGTVASGGEKENGMIVKGNGMKGRKWR